MEKDKKIKNLLNSLLASRGLIIVFIAVVFGLTLLISFDVTKYVSWEYFIFTLLLGSLLLTINKSSYLGERRVKYFHKAGTCALLSGIISIFNFGLTSSANQLTNNLIIWLILFGFILIATFFILFFIGYALLIMFVNLLLIFFYEE